MVNGFLIQAGHFSYAFCVPSFHHWAVELFQADSPGLFCNWSAWSHSLSMWGKYHHGTYTICQHSCGEESRYRMCSTEDCLPAVCVTKHSLFIINLLTLTCGTHTEAIICFSKEMWDVLSIEIYRPFGFQCIPDPEDQEILGNSNQRSLGTR